MTFNINFKYPIHNLGFIINNNDIDMLKADDIDYINKLGQKIKIYFKNKNNEVKLEFKNNSNSFFNKDSIVLYNINF